MSEYEYSDNEEDDYQYSDDDDYDDGQGTRGAAEDGGPEKQKRRACGGEEVGRGQVRVLPDVEAVSGVMQRHVDEVAEMLGLSDDDAQIVCHAQRWCNTDRLAERWFADPAKVATECGIAPPSHADSVCTGAAAAEPAAKSALASSSKVAAGLASSSFCCPVCAEEKDSAAEGFALGCGHLLCTECWTSGLSAYADSAEALRTKCFASSDCCPLIVPPSAFERFLPPDKHAKYVQWSVQKLVECSPKLQQCPRPGCKAVALCAYVASDCYLEVACSGCQEKWCFTCLADDHRPASCVQIKAWNDRAKDSDLTAMYIKANTKKCPACALEIIKDEGCAHMKCTQCGHHFCWLCLGPYSSHSEKTGGFYACNKFETRVQEAGRTEEEKRALLAAQQLKNYEMAFERHLNHRSALEAAERDLLAQVEAKVRELFSANQRANALANAATSAATSTSSSSSGSSSSSSSSRAHSHPYGVARSDSGGTAAAAWSSGMGGAGGDVEADVHQLRQAVEQVVSSRRVLAWSYVFKCYQFEEEGSERELQLFETYQGKLEAMTEDLQTRLSDMHDDRGAGMQPKHTGKRLKGGGDEADEYTTWRQGVVHLMGAVRSFSQNVVAFADNTDVYASGGAAEWEVRGGTGGNGQAASSSEPRAVWAWRDDSGTWNPFSDENTRTLEEAHAAEDKQVLLTSGGRRYRIDLRTMRQINLETKGQRPVRRRMESGNGNWTCGSCSYHNTNNAAVNATCLMCDQPRRL